jgi:hypothetical protein
VITPETTRRNFRFADFPFAARSMSGLPCRFVMIAELVRKPRPCGGLFYLYSD